MIIRGPLDFNTVRVWPFGGEHKFSPKSENYFIIEFKKRILMKCIYFYFSVGLIG